MATTVYVDWDVATDSGSGTSGDPYGNINWALYSEDAAVDLIVKVRGSTTTAFQEVGQTSVPYIPPNGVGVSDHFSIPADYSYTSLVIEPDTGYGISSGVPQLTLWNNNAYRFVLVVALANVTIRGFQIEQRNTNTSWEPDAIRWDGAGGTIEKCHIYQNRRGVYSNRGGNGYVTIKNCLIANYTDDTAATGVYVEAYSNVRLYNSVLCCGNASTGVGVENLAGTGDKANTEIYNTVFLDCGTEVSAAVTSDYNATDEGTIPSNLGANSVTGVVAGDFVSAAIANPRTGGADFRLNSATLVDVGTTVAAVSDDIEGTARPINSVYDIGLHEYAGGSSTTGIITARISQKGTINYGGPLA